LGNDQTLGVDKHFADITLVGDRQMEAHRDRAKSESMKGSLFSVSSGMMTSTRDHLLAVRRRWKEAEMTARLRPQDQVVFFVTNFV